MARNRVKTTREKIGMVDDRINGLYAEIEKLQKERNELLEKLREENIASLVAKIDKSGMTFEKVIKMVEDAAV